MQIDDAPHPGMSLDELSRHEKVEVIKNHRRSWLKRPGNWATIASLLLAVTSAIGFYIQLDTTRNEKILADVQLELANLEIVRIERKKQALIEANQELEERRETLNKEIERINQEVEKRAAEAQTKAQAEFLAASNQLEATKAELANGLATLSANSNSSDEIRFYLERASDQLDLIKAVPATQPRIDIEPIKVKSYTTEELLNPSDLDRRLEERVRQLERIQEDAR